MLPARKDKKKVVDEVWTPERVKSFLELQAPAGIDPDFHRLRRADLVPCFVESAAAPTDPQKP